MIAPRTMGAPLCAPTRRDLHESVSGYPENRADQSTPGAVSVSIELRFAQIAGAFLRVPRELEGEPTNDDGRRSHAARSGYTDHAYRSKSGGRVAIAPDRRPQRGQRDSQKAHRLADRHLVPQHGDRHSSRSARSEIAAGTDMLRVMISKSLNLTFSVTVRPRLSNDLECSRALAHVRVWTFFKPVLLSASVPFKSLRREDPGDETSASEFRQSSDGTSTGTAKPAFTRSIMTIVLKPLMSGF